MTSLRDLRFVVTLADQLHFGKAADALDVAQPQLSGVIRRLERELGFAIFVRRPRVLQTPAGELYISTARRLLTDADAGVHRARAVARGQVGLVRVGFAPVALLTGMARSLAALRISNPLIEMDLTEQHSARLWAGLDQDRYDLIVTREVEPRPGIESILAVQDGWAAALPNGHPLAGRDAIELAELRGERFILFNRASAPQYHDQIVANCRAAGFAPDIAQNVDSWSAILALVGSGFGVSIVSATLGCIELPGVRIQRLANTVDGPRFWVSWKPDRASPACAKVRGAILLDELRGDCPGAGGQQSSHV